MKIFSLPGSMPVFSEFNQINDKELKSLNDEVLRLVSLNPNNLEGLPDVLKSQAFFEAAFKENHACAVYIPKEMRTTAMLGYLVGIAQLSELDVLETLKDKDFYNQLVKYQHFELLKVPAEYQLTDNAYLAVLKNEPQLFAAIPQAFRSFKLSLAAIKRDWRLIRLINSALFSKENKLKLQEISLKQSIHALPFVDKELWTKNRCETAFSEGVITYLTLPDYCTKEKTFFDTVADKNISLLFTFPSQFRWQWMYEKYIRQDYDMFDEISKLPKGIDKSKLYEIEILEKQCIPSKVWDIAEEHWSYWVSLHACLLDAKAISRVPEKHVNNIMIVVTLQSMILHHCSNLEKALSDARTSSKSLADLFTKLERRGIKLSNETKTNIRNKIYRYMARRNDTENRLVPISEEVGVRVMASIEYLDHRLIPVSQETCKQMIALMKEKFDFVKGLDDIHKKLKSLGVKEHKNLKDLLDANNSCSKKNIAQIVSCFLESLGDFWHKKIDLDWDMMPYSILPHLPSEEQTTELCELCIKMTPSHVKYIKRDFLNDSTFISKIITLKRAVISYLFQEDISKLLPLRIKEDISDEAVKLDPLLFFSLPKDFQSERRYIKLMTSSDHFSKWKLPEHLKDSREIINHRENVKRRRNIEGKLSILEEIKKLKPIVDEYYEIGLSSQQEEELLEYFSEPEIRMLLEEHHGKSEEEPNIYLEFDDIEMKDFYALKIFVSFEYGETYLNPFHVKGIISVSLDALDNTYFEHKYEIEEHGGSN
jgi:hypothetical protein